MEVRMATSSEKGQQGISTPGLPGDQPQEIRAVIPSRLAALTPPGTVERLRQQEWWTGAQQVASDWQKISVWAGFWELALVPPVQHGRTHELAGLIASAGEQLALALAALVEAELWNVHRHANPPNTSNIDGRVVAAACEMTQRAMADLATYYLLSTGHTLANVTVRTLALDARLHPVLLDVVGSWSPVSSQDPRDWLSLNRDTARQLRRVARKTSSPPFHAVVEPAAAVVLSPGWQELDQLRGADYHRRRPQSAGITGVPLASPWMFSEGVASMNFGGSEYTDGDGLARRTTDLARRVMGELSSAMTTLLARVQAVIIELQSQRGQPSRSRTV
jgi:hypothetical protein